jgi:TolB protein
VSRAKRLDVNIVLVGLDKRDRMTNSSSRRRTLLWRWRCANVALLTLGLAMVPIWGRPQDRSPPPPYSGSYPPIHDFWSFAAYFEGFDFPIESAGPVDPTASADGRHVAFAASGWIWILDLGTGTATRIDRSAGVESRPVWSPNGHRLAFVRDSGSDTSVVVRDLERGTEQVIDTPALELDPNFSADGRKLFYSSAIAGDLDIWTDDLETGEKVRITTQRGNELHALPHPDGIHLIYISKTPGNHDELRMRDLHTGTEVVLRRGNALSMMRASIDPAGRLLAYTWPENSGWGVALLDLQDPGPTYWLVPPSDRLPLTPSWSADGKYVYYTAWNSQDQFSLRRVSRYGGDTEAVAIRKWDWGQPTGHLRIETRVGGELGLAPARISVTRADGHPMVASGLTNRLDQQNRLPYFDSPGTVDLTLPEGAYRVQAVQGLATPDVDRHASVVGGGTTDVDVAMTRLWDSRKEGYLSGDTHFHLNYGGPFSLVPDDLLPMMAAESLDVGTPLIANLYTRMPDIRWAGWEKSGTPPLIHFGQEVRSDFSGHLGNLGSPLYMPPFWGPGVGVFSREPLSNSKVLQAIRRAGGMGYYVHPALIRDPLGSIAAPHSVPMELLPDAILGDVDGLEIVCIWSDELGTSDIWYRLLNLGRAIVPTAGTDSFPNYFRGMSVGTARAYAKVGSNGNSYSDFLKALQQGKSLVTNGPIPLLSVEGVEPGGTLSTAKNAVDWHLKILTPVPVEVVELLVNGRVVWKTEGPTRAGSVSYNGTLHLPSGGWIAARAYGGRVSWPVMASYPFGHTAPIWVGAIGSVDPEVRRIAAEQLLTALDQLAPRLGTAYAGEDFAKLSARFTRAKECLREYIHHDGRTSPQDNPGAPHSACENAP